MPDENIVDDQLEAGNDNGGENEAKSSRTPDSYEKEISDLRKEAAKHRVEKQKVKDELQEFNAWKDSQKSELDRANDKLKELETELTRERRSRLQTEAAKKADLDLDLADRVRGDTIEEMIEDAKLMAAKYPKSSAPGAGHAGERGKPVGSKQGTDWLKDMWLKS
jgi:chromosome segregation ATPase